MDLSEPGSELELDCPECAGKGCDRCQDGIFKIEGCPNAYCRDVSDTIDLIEEYQKGMQPVAGGVLDQSAYFIEAVKFLRREEALVK